MSRLTPVLIEQVAEAVKQTGRLLTDPCCLERVEAKSPTDFVTNVDFSVQHRLEKALLQLTPWAQFWGEEGEKIPVDTAKPYWLLDPVYGSPPDVEAILRPCRANGIQGHCQRFAYRCRARRRGFMG